jgi:hypothetical protein
LGKAVLQGFSYPEEPPRFPRFSIRRVQSAILLGDFIRTAVQTARDETTREITDAISSHAAYLSPIEGDLMHNAAVEYLKQFRGEQRTNLKGE